MGEKYHILKKFLYNKFLTEFERWRGEASDPNPGSLNIQPLFEP